MGNLHLSYFLKKVSDTFFSDSVGILKSLWRHRLEAGADHTDRVLSQLSSSDLARGDKLGGFEVIRDPAVLRRLL